jgi:hypothetical protein
MVFTEVLNGPALKYEVGVCIKTGYIVWVNGPFVGSENDGTVFSEGLGTLLAEDEAVEVDGEYKGNNKIKGPATAISQVQRKEKSVVRGWHENVNGQLKLFNVLNACFRHCNPPEQMMRKHGLCFDSC